MAHSLQDRQLGYEDSYNQNIISRIPVIIKLDGRNFSRVTKNIQKPFCHKTSALLGGTMLSLAKQIDGVVFGYQYSDKIILVLRNDRSNDEDAWFGNNIQKMASISASMCTYEFMSQVLGMNESPRLEGNINFAAKVFGVPSIKESINYLLFRQFRCVQTAINEAVYHVLWPKYGEKTFAFLEDKSMEVRKNILDDANFDFDSLPGAYRHGSAVYLIPSITQTSQGQVARHKWLVDFNIPLFSDSKEWLGGILATGSDILRPERDYEGLAGSR